MSDIIRLLPDSIANQIAAGEVVQRPASVIKELLENAIDAGSKHVRIIIKEGGKNLIQVIDNGMGMSESDARMSFERHATSKIKTVNDIYTIKTMGFRGEALASIAAVAQVSMITKLPDKEWGVQLEVEGSEIKSNTPVASEKGTSVCVKNLFFNVPARRKFLKSKSVEMRHILDEFFRIALANPDITFEFFQNDTETYNLPVTKLSNRIVGLFGKLYQEQLVPCEEQTPHVKVWGYIGKPEFAKKTRGEQYFYINNRFIKNNYLNHAVMSAYEALLADSSFPFYVLFIEINPEDIDINVHPTKTEVKLADERTVYAIVRAAVKRALGTHNVVPSLDFGWNVNLDPFNLTGKDQQENKPAGNRGKAYEQFKSFPQRNNLTYWESLYEQNEKKHFDFDADDRELIDTELTLQSAANKMTSDPATLKKRPQTTPGHTFQIHYAFIATQVKSGMMIIDQQAAHERILYEQYASFLVKKTTFSQQSLFPQHVHLNPADFELVQELKEEIKALGFVFSTLGQNIVVINGVPTDIKSGDEKLIFEGIIEQFKENQDRLSLTKNENLAHAIAKRMSIKKGQRLEPEEMSNLIDRLFACETPNYSPDGQLTFYILELHRIAELFKK